MKDTPQQQQERPHPASEIPDADTGTEDESSYPGDDDIEPDEEPDGEPDPAFDDPPGTRLGSRGLTGVPDQCVEVVDRVSLQ